MLKDILETPIVLTDEDLDAVAAGKKDCCCGPSVTVSPTVQVSVLSAQAEDGSQAGVINVNA